MIIKEFDQPVYREIKRYNMSIVISPIAKCGDRTCEKSPNYQSRGVLSFDDHGMVLFLQDELGMGVRIEGSVVQYWIRGP